MVRNILFAAIALTTLSCGAPKTQAEDKKPLSAENTAALTAIKAEPKVKDAVITDAHVLYAAVEDDGTSRKGYAQYLCEVLAQHKSDVTSAKVIKFGSMNDSQADTPYGILLGECDCNFK